MTTQPRGKNFVLDPRFGFKDEEGRVIRTRVRLSLPMKSYMRLKRLARLGGKDPTATVCDLIRQECAERFEEGEKE